MYHPREPHYSFTIPSIHDDTTLDCRIYHPHELSLPPSHENDSATQWQKRGIVMAHPYAPLGGSYDDRVVGIVVEEFLALGYVVGTFNFRGAHGSKGRTSWTGKPEVNDYISFAGLFIHYLWYIRPHPTPETAFFSEQSLVSPQMRSLDDGDGGRDKDDVPTVILGGYSHGSLILQHLPPVPSILQPFSAPVSGSAAHEIILRARKLSDQSNLEWINIARNHERQARRQHDRTASVTVGGEETSPNKRRSSREVRRSAEGRRSVDLGRNRLRSLSLTHKRKKTDADHLVSSPQTSLPNAAVQMPKVRYLLISPLTGPISLLAAPGLGHKFWPRQPENQDVIGKHNTLILYGDQDIFSSARKITAWAAKLSAEPGYQVTHVEVAGAGHFWLENGVEEKLRTSLREWEARPWR